jgi:RsiW-degrading membrane proteinase PrsW (M82 family)
VNPNALDPLKPIDRNQQIDGWNVRFYFLSRNPGVLLALAFVIIGISIGIAWFVQKPLRELIGFDDFKPAAIHAELVKPKPDLAHVLELLPKAARSWGEEPLIAEWIAASPLTQSEKLVATAAWVSLREGDGFEPSADLLYFAHYVKPLRFANELIGDHYLATDQLDRAAAYYRREAKFPEASTAREKLFAVAMVKHDKALLRELGHDPAFAGDSKPEHRIYFAALDKNWSGLVKPLGDLQTRLITPVPIALATIAGLVWFLVALQSIQPPGLFSFRPALLFFAVFFGMLSTFPTIISGLWMEETFGLHHSDDLVGNFLFFMLSVGPREELIKLALVLPLIPVCLLRKSRLEMLIGAGGVGLGFAIWENLQYFAQYGSAAAFPRFLTANFFHLALTGLNGLALYDLLRNPLRGFVPFTGILAGTMVAHGAYDFMASVPGMPMLIFGSMMAFMLVSLFFFRRLRGLRDGSTDQFSIGATFAVGISALAGIVLICAAREISLIPAVATLAVTGFGMIMVGYMFYWQLGSGMSAVEEVASPSYR